MQHDDDESRFGSLAPRPANSSGDRRVDAAAGRGAKSLVWDRLEYLFPRVKRHGYSIWLARRDGRVRRLIERDPRFVSIRTEFGPSHRGEWELLALAALEAAGIGKLTTSQLYVWTDPDPPAPEPTD